jgi:hypothetical protein
MPVGGSVAFSRDVLLPVSVQPGWYFVTTYVDHEGLILESNNDNNAGASERLAIVAPHETSP